MTHLFALILAWISFPARSHERGYGFARTSLKGLSCESRYDPLLLPPREVVNLAYFGGAHLHR
jgi:hypothetical protein